jgi:hypothetical protein
MGHAAFLELLLSDEVTRRASHSAMLRSKAAGLGLTMRLDTWNEPDDLRYGRTLWCDYAALVDSLTGILDLYGGLAGAVDVAAYTAMRSHIANLLNLEAGLQAALGAPWH